MSKQHRRAANDAEVDMTPMLDIVFIMLIFFIVSSTFIHESGLSLSEHKKNQDKQENAQQAQAIVVKICSDQTVLVDERSVDIRAIRANIERKRAEGGQATVIIETTHEAGTGTLVAVMDQARAAKAQMSVAPISSACTIKETAATLASL